MQYISSQEESKVHGSCLYIHVLSSQKTTITKLIEYPHVEKYL